MCDGGSVKEGNLTNSLCNTTQDGLDEGGGGVECQSFKKDLKVKGRRGKV